MSGVRIIPPSAVALIGSFRGVGYSIETALADLIDNSISAGASAIDIGCEWNDGDPGITITDDGNGMSEGMLVEAMRFGGMGPEAARSEADLGRFGLGLKTASFSQCRCLTVFSKTASGTSAFTWDLDEIRKADGAWHLLEGGPALPTEVAEQLETRKSGTAVAWRKVDFGRKTDRPDHAAFMGDLERADMHLGMIFHRFIKGDARRVAITINGSKVKAWDPFLETHQATIPLPEKYFDSPGGIVRTKGFVLPHRDRFKNESEFLAAGGPGGWTVQQGFYVYREKRLLSAGGWLGTGGSRRWTREEPSRLARIQIDIPNTGDQDWRIDIRKAIARPPDKIRDKLQLLADDARGKARDVFVHRGEHGIRPRQAEVEKIWQINPEAAAGATRSGGIITSWRS